MISKVCVEKCDCEYYFTISIERKVEGPDWEAAAHQVWRLDDGHLLWKFIEKKEIAISMVTFLISDMSIKVKDVQWRNAPLPMGPFNYLHFPDDLSIMIGQRHLKSLLFSSYSSSSPLRNPKSWRIADQNKWTVIFAHYLSLSLSPLLSQLLNSNCRSYWPRYDRCRRVVKVIPGL